MHAPPHVWGYLLSCTEYCAAKHLSNSKRFTHATTRHGQLGTTLCMLPHSARHITRTRHPRIVCPLKELHSHRTCSKLGVAFSLTLLDPCPTLASEARLLRKSQTTSINESRCRGDPCFLVLECVLTPVSNFHRPRARGAASQSGSCSSLFSLLQHPREPTPNLHSRLPRRDLRLSQLAEPTAPPTCPSFTQSSPSDVKYRQTQYAHCSILYNHGINPSMT